MNQPDQPFDYALQQAIGLHTGGDIDHAVIHYRELLETYPDHPDLWHLLGIAAHQKDDNKLAVDLISSAISLKDDVPDYHNNLGMAFRGLGNERDAEQCFRTALECRPTHTKALSNLASVLRLGGEFAAALKYARRAVATNPNDAEAVNNLGNVEKDAGLLDDAVASYRRSLDLSPNFALAHWNLSLALLSTGHYEEGFEEMAWRWQWSGFPGRRTTFEQPEWDGGNLNGRTVLLYGEQGLGDTLHMLRFSRAVRQNAGRVVLQLPDPILPLAEELELADNIVSPAGALPDFDVHASLMDVPRLCGLQGPDLFMPPPYLMVKPNRKTEWQKRVEVQNGRKVGLNWSGNPANPVEKFRQLPSEQIDRLAELGNVTWFNLQKGDTPAPALATSFPIIDTGPAPLEDTAALIDTLDLVITSDTAVGHLAGALGKNVWVLLHHAPDWRWGQDSQTPWYPSARLFRQPSPGDWASVFDQVCAEFATFSP